MMMTKKCIPRKANTVAANLEDTMVVVKGPNIILRTMTMTMTTSTVTMSAESGSRKLKLLYKYKNDVNCPMMSMHNYGNFIHGEEWINHICFDLSLYVTIF